MKTRWRKDVLEIEGVDVRNGLIDNEAGKFMIIVAPELEGEEQRLVMHEHAEELFDKISARAEDVPRRGETIYLEKESEKQFVLRYLPGRTTDPDAEASHTPPGDHPVTREWANQVLREWDRSQEPVQEAPAQERETPRAERMQEVPLPDGEEQGNVRVTYSNVDTGATEFKTIHYHARGYGDPQKDARAAVFVLSQDPASEADLAITAASIAERLCERVGRTGFAGATFFLHYPPNVNGSNHERFVRAEMTHEGERPVIDHSKHEVPREEVVKEIGEENLERLEVQTAAGIRNPLAQAAFMAGLDPTQTRAPDIDIDFD